VTYNSAHPARSDGTAAGPATDVKTFATAVLLTFGTGLLMMVGYGLLDSFFGAILGLVAAGFGLAFWARKHGKAFPAAIPTRSVIVLAVIDGLLGVGLVQLAA
jgi:hypothetical protein